MGFKILDILTIGSCELGPVVVVSHPLLGGWVNDDKLAGAETIRHTDIACWSQLGNQVCYSGYGCATLP